MYLPPGAQDIITRIVAEEILRQDLIAMKQALPNTLPISLRGNNDAPSSSKMPLPPLKNDSKSTTTNKQHLQNKVMCRFYNQVRSIIHQVPSLACLDDLSTDEGDSPSSKCGSTLLALLCKFNSYSPVPLDLIQLVHEANPRAIARIQTTKDKSTPLHLAAYLPQPDTCTEVIEYLMDQYPEAMQMTDFFGRSPLHNACYSKDASLPIVNEMIKRFPDAVRQADQQGHYPLDLAVRRNAPVAVLERLEKEFPMVLTHCDVRGGTPLHNACKVKTTTYDTMAFLVRKAPGCIQIEDRGRKTPLQYAAAFQPVPVLELLLANVSSNQNLMDNEGYNLLHYAVLSNSTEVVDLIAARFPHMVMEPSDDLDERLPLHVLIYGRHTFSLCDSKLRICKVLVRHNPASLVVRDAFGQTPLAVAEQTQNSTLVDFFTTETPRYQRTSDLRR